MDLSRKRTGANGADEPTAAIDRAPALQPPTAALEWAVRSVGDGARLLSVESLDGGSSHANHVLRVTERSGATRDYVLRRWVRTDWQLTDPAFSPEQEAANLGLARSGGVSAPELVACDGGAANCDVPALLMTRMPGAKPGQPRDVESFVRQLAAALGTIHAVDPVVARDTVPPYRRYYEGTRWAPAISSQPANWERTIRDRAIRDRAIELAGRDPLENPSAFIHRDYHHGNTLWVRGRLTAVVDWTTASFGSPLADVAHMRANLAMSFGLPTAQLFLAAWQQVEPTSRWDPVWDLRIAVDFIPDLSRMGLSARRARRLEEFVTQAIAELGDSITRSREPTTGQPTRRLR